MAEAIKDFFKKKKLDAKFKMAGSGHKLTDSTSTKKSDPKVGTSSQSKQSNSMTANRSAQRAGEAALDRIQKQQQSTHNKTNTLENILQEERKKITEEFKIKDEIQVIVINWDLLLIKTTIANDVYS